MKEIIAIIRPNKAGTTRNALEELGYPSMTAAAVLGRGHQRGIAGEISVSLDPKISAETTPGAMKYIPKRYLSLIVSDSEVEQVVASIISINQSGSIGDGKIFIAPLEDALRIRTGEGGDEALA